MSPGHVQSRQVSRVADLLYLRLLPKLLRCRDFRPRARNGPEHLPANGYSMTSSARLRSVGGTATPSTFAVLRLMTSSIFDLLHWHVGRFFPLQDPAGIHTRLPPSTKIVRSIANEPPSHGVLAH